LCFTSVSMMLVYGIRQSFAVFFPPILNDFGWSRGSTALMLSLHLMVYGFVAPVAGYLADRWNPRRVMIIGITIIAVATAACGLANELWHFYLLFGVLVPVGNACCGWPLVGPTLANWFLKRRGLAMGIGQAGSGLSATFAIFAQYNISLLGWRYAYFVLAGTLAIILLPLCFAYFRYRPEDKGVKAYGTDKSSIVPIESSGNIRQEDWTFKRALKTHRLWLLVATQALFWGLGYYLVLAHQVKATEDVGYTTTFAASILALLGVFMAIGQLSGILSDWLGREKTAVLANILIVGSLIALISVKDTSQSWLLYIFAIGFGLGTGVFGPTVAAGAADIFYGRHFGAINGLLMTGTGLGGVIGPWLGGYIYDISGSYAGAFCLCIGGFLLSCVLFWIVAPRKQRSSE